MIDTREYSRTLTADISKMMCYFQKVINTIFQDYPELAGVSIPSSIKIDIFWSMSLHIVPFNDQLVVGLMSIPWILVLYKKRKRIAGAVSFLLLVTHPPTPFC